MTNRSYANDLATLNATAGKGLLHFYYSLNWYK